MRLVRLPMLALAVALAAGGASSAAVDDAMRPHQFKMKGVHWDAEAKAGEARPWDPRL